MELNNMPPTEMPEPVPAVAAPVTPQPAVMITDEKSKGGHGKVIMVVSILIVVVAVIGVGYWYMSNSAISSTTSNSEVKTAAPITPNQSLAELKAELEAISIEEVSAQEDLTQLDQDLASL